MRVLSNSLAFALALLLGGCATVTLAPEDFEATAKQFPNESDAAALYVVRGGGVGSALIFFTALDGEPIGPLAPNTIQRVVLPPGAYTVSLIGKANQASVPLQVAAGRNYFLRVDVRLGWETGHGHLQAVDETLGRELVTRSKRAATLGWESRAN
jgi:hypothetical protein